jgi:hypothetical protein
MWMLEEAFLHIFASLTMVGVGRLHIENSLFFFGVRVEKCSKNMFYLRKVLRMSSDFKTKIMII